MSDDHANASNITETLAAYFNMDVVVFRTGDVEPMLTKCWATVCDAGLTISQHWVNASLLIGILVVLLQLLLMLLVMTMSLMLVKMVTIVRQLYSFIFSEKNDTLSQCCYNCGSTSQTLAQH